MQLAGISAQATVQQTSGTPSPRLVRAAHEFEAQMMKELLEPMTRSGSNLEGDSSEESASGSAGALGTFASEALAQAISAAGGFGIANKVLRTLSHSGNPSETGKKIGNLQGDPALKTSE
jgi:Rod binding domain-containing protein